MSIASNIASLPAVERSHEANSQCVRYLDETPYAETWTFSDRSKLEYDWKSGKFSVTNP